MALVDVSYEEQYRYPYLNFKRFIPPFDGMNSEEDADEAAAEYKRQCEKNYDLCRKSIERNLNGGMNTFKTLFNAYKSCDSDVFDYVFVNLHCDGVISDADYFFFEFAQKMDEVGLNQYNSYEKADAAREKFNELYKTIPPEIYSEVIALINRFGYFSAIKPELITIPEGVTEIGSDCFSISEFSSKCFHEYSSIKEVIFPNTVTRIEPAAFKNCGRLEKVQLSDNIVEIPQECFWGCSKLSEITLPKNLQHIENNAFAYCGRLKEIELSSENQNLTIKDGALFSRDLKTLIRYPSDKEDTIFFIPEETETISDFAFHSARNLQTVDFSNVREIGESAFEESSVKNIYLPDTVEKCGDKAFANCYNLITAALSCKMCEIPQKCFANCHSLMNITIPHGIEKISTDAFQKCGLLNTIDNAGQHIRY